MNYSGDYHTHTRYSDGTGKVADNAKAAAERGLKELAITDHGFTSPRIYALRWSTFCKQREEILRVQAEYEGKLRIYHGVEADLLSEDGEIDLTLEQANAMDFLVMGYHSYAKPTFSEWKKLFLPAFCSVVKYPSAETVRSNTRAMINAIKRYPIDVVSHLNHLFKVDCYEVAKVCADYGTKIELNAKHVNFSHEEFEKVLKTGAGIIADSDAHFPQNVGVFEGIEAYLKMHGLTPEVLENYGKVPVFPRKKRGEV